MRGEGEGGAGASVTKLPSSRKAVLLLLAPITWAAFSWLFFLSATERLSLPFYALVRGAGLVLYFSGIGSQSFVTALLSLASCALLIEHIALIRGQTVRDVRSLLGSMGLVAGLLLYLWIGSLVALVLLGASSLVLVAVDLYRAAGAGQKERTRMLGVYAFGLTAVSALIAVLASATWIANGFAGGRPLAGSGWTFALTGVQLVGFLDPILAQIILVFFLSWMIRLAISPSYTSPFGAWARDAKSSVAASVRSAVSIRRWSLAMLGASIVIVVFLGLYPYLPAINPTSAITGVDTRLCYYNWLEGLPMGNTCQGSLAAVPIPWGDQRIGALYMLRLITVLTGSPVITLKAVPALLGIFLVLATFVLTLEGTGEVFLAGLSSLLAAVSFEVVAGIDAGILANWAALSTAFVLFAIVLRGMRTQRLAYLLPAYAVFALLLFLHPWTWALASVILVVFLAVELVQSLFARQLRTKRFELILLGTLLVAALASQLLSSFLPVGSAFYDAYAYAIRYVQPANVYQVASSLQATSLYFLGGAMADPIIFLLGILGVLSIPSLRGRFGKLLAVWLSILLIGVVLIPSGSTLQARLIYFAPLQVFAALGLGAILRPVVASLGSQASSRKLSTAILACTLLSVVGLSLGFAMEYLGTFF